MPSFHGMGAARVEASAGLYHTGARHHPPTPAPLGTHPSPQVRAQNHTIQTSRNRFRLSLPRPEPAWHQTETPPSFPNSDTAVYFSPRERNSRSWRGKRTRPRKSGKRQQQRARKQEWRHRLRQRPPSSAGSSRRCRWARTFPASRAVSSTRATCLSGR